jgi:predicted ATP-grasp superfamily ATP-dependent carboligase
MSNLSGRSPRQVGAVVLGSDFKALGYIRSLGKRHIPCVVVDDLPRSAWFSRYAQRRFRWHGGMWGPAFVDFLLRIARQHDLAGWLLVPVQDEVVECVAKNRERLGQTFRLVTQDWEVVRWAHDKRLAHGVADEVGVPHPKTWYPTDALDLERMPIEYPAIVKPSISIHLQYATGRKAFSAADPAELRAVYARAAAVMAPDALMVQEMIPGDGRSQYSVAAFCKDGEWLAGMTARRTRQYPADFGLSSSFVEAVDVPQLLEPAKKLLARCRLSGMVEVEFKRDNRDGVYKLLDINVRPWGWHTLCIACGLDFPYIQFADALGEAAPMGPVRYGFRWRRLLTDVPAALQETGAGTVSPWAYLRSLGGATVPSVFDVKDPLPVIGDLAVAVSRIIKARRGRPLLPALPPVPVPARPRST